jgi:hypothetical protein
MCPLGLRPTRVRLYLPLSVRKEFAMSDVFISYSTLDQELADFVEHHLKADGVSVFLASASLSPGDVWSETIRKALRLSKTVVLLASRNACKSEYVRQEFGGAFFAEGKTIIPIVWDMKPEELPGWMKQFHAIDLRKYQHPEEFVAELKAVSGKIKLDKFVGLGVLAAILVLVSKMKG